MSYLVLARKYRPRTFDEVVGQDTVTRTLRNALASGRIGHAFLLSGARGVGKTTTARILARALNCGKSDGPTPEPCGECPACVEIAAGTCLDVQEIDGATHNGVEQVRELRESARYNPARDRFKIWIIDEVHMLSTGAFNALLKTLEEPPPRVKLIFATTEYHKIPDTILSRCQQYDFRMIPARELQAHLRQVAKKEAIEVSDEALARIARAAEGSARDALSLFDQVLAFSGQKVQDEDISALLGLVDRELLLAGSRAVADGDSLALLDLVERLSDHGADYRNFTRELILHFREILLLKVAPAESGLLAQVMPEEREQLRPLAAGFSHEDLLRIFEVLTKVETDLRLAQDPRVTLELALMKAAQLQKLMPFTELVDRVERLAGGAPLPRQGGEPAAGTAASCAGGRPDRRRGRARGAPHDAGRDPGLDVDPRPVAALAGPAAAHRQSPRPAGNARHRGGSRFRPHGRPEPGRVPAAGPEGRGARDQGAHRDGPRRRRRARRRGQRAPAPARARRGVAGARGAGGARPLQRQGRRRQKGSPVNPQKLMKQLQQAQERMQQEIAVLEIEATSGGGMVKVVMDGQKSLKSLRIDPEVVSKEDVEMLQDLVTAAVNEAARKVDEAIQEKIGGLAGGMKIPGLL